MFKWLKRQTGRFVNGITSIVNPDAWFVRFITGGTKSDSGITVNAKTAVTFPPVWYALSKISGHVVQMPLTPYKRVGGGGEKDSSHPAYRLLRTRANPYQSAAVFMETLVVHSLLWGNGKAAIIRNSNRQPVELLLIPPDSSVTCYIDGVKLHLIKLDDDDRIKSIGVNESMKRQGWYVIPDKDVLHIPGVGLTGTSGMELFKVGRESIGLGLASEKAANKDFANGSKPAVLLEAPQGVLQDDKDAREYMANFNQFHQGLDNHGKAGLLRNGIHATALPTTNQATQWIDQRKFQRQEIALLFLLESILGDDESVSYNSLEQKNLAYLSNCLMRWLVKIEQECDEKLLSARQKSRDSHYFKFNTAVLLRADFKTTIESLSGAIRSRIMSPNEARAKLDMLPYEGGDEYQNPAIYVPEKDGEEGGETTPEPSTPEDKNRAAIVAHLKHMIGVEAKHVLSAAGNKRNYTGWIDGFYSSDRWVKTISRSIVDMGGDAELAQRHCEQSKNELLEIAGAVTPDGLADAVAETVERWPSRADSLAQDVISEGLINV